MKVDGQQLQLKIDCFSEFKESDIFICQHRTDLSLRIVNAVIKNRYPICTKAHVFDAYPVRLVTVRNYQVGHEVLEVQLVNLKTQVRYGQHTARETMLCDPLALTEI